MNNKPLYLQALDALRQREMLLRVLAFTFVTILFWIGFSIYQSQTGDKLPVDIRKHTEVLNPTIDRDVFRELEARKRYSDQELQNFPLYEIITDEEGTPRVVEVGTSLVLPATQPSPRVESSTQSAVPAVDVVLIPTSSPPQSITPTVSP